MTLTESALFELARIRERPAERPPWMQMIQRARKVETKVAPIMEKGTLYAIRGDALWGVVPAGDPDYVVILCHPDDEETALAAVAELRQGLA